MKLSINDYVGYYETPLVNKLASILRVMITK